MASGVISVSLFYIVTVGVSKETNVFGGMSLSLHGILLNHPSMFEGFEGSTENWKT